MSQPFGFSASGDDDDDRRDDSSGDSGSGDQPGGGGGGGGQFGFPFGAGGFGGSGGAGGAGGAGGGSFDPSQLGQMLSQFGQMLGSMGTSMGRPDSGPVNYNLAKNVAMQNLPQSESISSGSKKAVDESVRLVELWLDQSTQFPAAVQRTECWTPRDWVERTLPTWEKLCNPIAQQMNAATRESLPEEAHQIAGPLLGMLDQMGGMGFGVQLGTGLAKLAPAVLFSSEIGVPFGEDGVAALSPAAVDSFADELELPRQEVLVFLAAREAAHLRLFAGAPWLRARVIATVEEYARGIRIDTSALDDLASSLDPASLSDPQKLQEMLSSGSIGPKVSNVNEAALGRLEALLALIEGWVDAVVRDAIGERLPTAAQQSENWLRRRATGGSAEKAFATIVGLELRPRLAREASEMWRRVAESLGTEKRDSLWSHPDLLPSGEDIENPAAVIDRLLDESESDDSDPIEEIERFLRETGEAGEPEKGDGDEGDGDEGDDPGTSSGGPSPENRDI